ncbi:MAG TPA: PEP-CTERM sorting domain-containing protein [Candidatus Acidoferrum sp.]|jgi:hypothetical protein
MIEHFKKGALVASVLRALTLGALIVVTCAAGALADEVYTYQGLPFDTFSGETCPSVCALSGSFTLSSPIGDNTVVLGITPDSFSFTDGHTILNNTNSIFEDLGFQTDATGNIVGWLFATVGSDVTFESSNLGDPSGDFSFDSNGNSANNSAAGTWTTSSSVVNTPEPSSLFLLGAGLAGLLGLRKRSRTLATSLAT